MLSLQAAFRKRLQKRGMGVSGAGGVAKPGWAQTKQPIPGGGSKKPATPQVKPLPGMTPLGIPKKAVRKADRSELVPIPRKPVSSTPGKPGTIKPAKLQTPRQAARTKQKFAREQWGGKAIKAIRKAVRAIDKHKDKRGSTAHHGRGGGRDKRPALSVPEQHQLRIARDTLRMNPAMVAFAGGPDIEESKKIIRRLTGR